MKASFQPQHPFFCLINRVVHTANSDYEISITQCSADRFLGRLRGTKNTHIEISGNSNKFSINHDEILHKVEKTLKSNLSDIEWKRQESECYIPALINKEVDIVAQQTGKRISADQKNKIRSKALKRKFLADQFRNVKNLNGAAQTSIGQTTSTILDKDKELNKFFKAEKLSRELQSEIKAAISRKIADEMYCRVTGQSVDMLRNIVRREARRELNSPKK